MKKHLPKIFKLISAISPKLAARFALKVFATPTRIARPESEREMFERARVFKLSTGIVAFEWGNPEGPLVMLVHGWNGRGTQLSPFAKALEKNFRIVALDGPGHGESPAGPKGMTNPVHYAQFIIDSQNELDPRGAASVIAHSFGGGCSVLAASRGLKTKSLVLVASPAFYDRVVDFFAKGLQLSDKAKDFFIENIIAITHLHPRELNIGLIGSKLNLPLLVVHDKGDNAVDYLSAEAIHKAWPGSKLLTTEGLGHRRILKDAKVVSETAEFIASLR